MIYAWLLLCLALRFKVSAAETHTFNFTTGWVTAKPDGVIEKKMISFNGEWPLPDIHVKKGDRVQIYLTNGFTDLPTSLHFHGLKHNTTVGNSASMDGAGMLTQCPIMPGQTYLYNFTVTDQVGTYWYHSHSGAQYADGMRGAFIVHDDDPPFDFDEEMTIMLGDLYQQAYYDVSKQFSSRYNPTGAEPVPQNLLFNNTLNATIDFVPNKTYMLRFINGAFFVSQYLYIEGHSFTIVEVDGMYVKPFVTDFIHLASGQRMSVLVDSKDNTNRNYEIVQYADKDMLDNPPSALILKRAHLIRYNPDMPWINDIVDPNPSNATNEFSLTNYDNIELYRKYDRQVVLDLHMEMMEDGVNYMFFNNITFTAPKVPPLTTVLTAGKFARDPRIYGNVNAVVLEHNEIVEVVLNNYDNGAHPFHLHGHNFQVVQKSSAFDLAPVPYNESNPFVPFPEYPVIRDTAVVEPYGHLVLRFRADNPGVWVFHCHVNWHLVQGLATLFVEAPEILQTTEVLSENYKQVCKAAHMPLSGNAAGNSDDWLDLTGAPTQPGPLPTGFTLKGYIALLLASLFGIAGIYTITQFGLDDKQQDDDDDELREKLLSLLKNNDL